MENNMNSVKCPSCGAALEGNTCPYCGYVATNVPNLNNSQGQPNTSQSGTYPNAGMNPNQSGYLYQGTNPNQSGYLYQGTNPNQSGYLRQGVNANQGTYNRTNQVQPKKNNTWLWVLGWIFLFPVPLSILIWRIKSLKPWFRGVLIGVLWIVVFIIAGVNGNKDGDKADRIAVTTESITEEKTTEEKTEKTTENTTESTTEATGDETEKEEVNAFESGDVTDYTYNIVTFKMPNYINKVLVEQENGNISASEESGDDFYNFAMTYVKFDNDDVIKEIKDNREELEKEYANGIVKGLGDEVDASLDLCNHTTINDYQVLNITISMTHKTTGKSADVQGYVFELEDNGGWITIMLSQSTKGEHDYFGDLKRIAESVTLVDGEDGVDPDLKSFLDGYEDFIDSYIEFMQTYDSNDATMLIKYGEFLKEYAEFSQEIEKYDEKKDEMSEADQLYYVEVTTRCAKKLADAAIKME